MLRKLYSNNPRERSIHLGQVLLQNEKVSVMVETHLICSTAPFESILKQRPLMVGARTSKVESIQDSCSKLVPSSYFSLPLQPSLLHTRSALDQRPKRACFSADRTRVTNCLGGRLLVFKHLVQVNGGTNRGK